ncbi:MAG: hypothetical protein ACRDGL_03995, partial [Candidatus Limnocylindrales bacterium]
MTMRLTNTSAPSSTVAPASGSPSHTLPPTDLAGPSTPAGQSPVLPLVLLALGGLAFGVTLLKPAPARLSMAISKYPLVAMKSTHPR